MVQIRASSIPAVLRNLPLILLLRGGLFLWLCGDSPDNVIAYALISVFGEMSHQSQPRGILFGEIQQLLHHTCLRQIIRRGRSRNQLSGLMKLTN